MSTNTEPTVNDLSPLIKPGVMREPMFLLDTTGSMSSEHDNALDAYRKVAASNDHVRVVTFDSETDPTVIAESLLSMNGV